MKKPVTSLLFALLCAETTSLSITPGDDASVKSAASTIAYGLMKYYTGNNTGDTPGNLPSPYYCKSPHQHQPLWAKTNQFPGWEAGAMFGTMIDYWYMTGDASYNAATSQAMIHQASPTRDFMPINQTRTEGNDDQGFWAMASMSAAENKYPDPPPDKPGWLELTQAVFNHYVARWDKDNCDGGLRWQIFTFNAGYNYKNSISNGCFFNIAARLARYTGNSTYADWAAAIFEWEQRAGLITREFAVLDGIHVDHHRGGGACVNRTDTQWSYNAGIFLQGAAVMYNLTRGEVWKARTDGLVRHSLKEFAKDGVVFEPACEPARGCDYNGLSFKGYYIRWLAATVKMAPHTYEAIYPVMRKTAEAAARACSGSDASFRGVPGTACGFSWTEDGGKFDGLVGVGQQMCALDAVMYTLVDGVGAAVTQDTGGTSRGNPAAGGESDDSHLPLPKPITAGDRAGAAIVTIIFVAIGIGGSAFMLWHEEL